MNIGDVYGTLRAEGSQFVIDAQKAGEAAGDKSVQSFGSRFTAGLKKSLDIGNIVTGIGQGIGQDLFRDAKSAVTEFVGGSAAAYREMQTSIALLDSALKANVKNWDGNTDAIEKTMQAQMRLGFDDEQLRNSLALLVGKTKDVAAAQMLQVAAMELSRVKNIDLESATQKMVLAAAGNMRGLKSVGIELKAGSSATEIYAAVMALAGDRAEAFANTSEGRLLYAQIKVKEAMEKVGAAMDWVSNTAIPPLSDGVTMVADGLELLATNAGLVVPILGLVAAAWVSGLGVAVAGFTSAVLAGIAASTAAAVPAALAEGAAIGEAVVVGETAAVVAGAPVVAGGVTAAGGGAVLAGGAIGTAVGGAIGAAAALAIPLLIVGSVAILAQQVRGPLKDLGGQIREAILGAGTAAGKNLADDLPWPLGPKNTPDFSIGPLEHLLGGDSIPKAAAKVANKVTEAFKASGLDIKLLAAGIPQAVIDQLEAGGSTLEMGADGVFKVVPIAMTNAELATEAIAAGAPQSIADQIAAGKGTLSVAADGTFSVIPKNLLDAKNDAEVIASEIPATIASALRDRRTSVTKAMDQLKTDMKDALSPAAEEAGLVGALTGADLAAGLASSDPIVKAQAEATKQLILGRLSELDSASWGAGDAAGTALVDAYIAAVAKIKNVSVTTRYSPFGVSVTDNQDIRVPTQARALGGPVEAGYPYLVNENTPRSEIFVPQTAGTIVPAAQMSAAKGATITNHFYANPTRADVMTVLRQQKRQQAQGLLG